MPDAGPKRSASWRGKGTLAMPAAACMIPTSSFIHGSAYSQFRGGLEELTGQRVGGDLVLLAARSLLQSATRHEVDVAQSGRIGNGVAG